MVNYLILYSVTQPIMELTKEYSQIKGTKVSFLEVFQSCQLHRTARKQIKSKGLLENNFLLLVQYSSLFGTVTILKRNIPLWTYISKNFALSLEGKLRCWPAKQKRH